eukprot:scaffold3574_cov121-Isochrysis_galbana.AAC.2
MVLDCEVDVGSVVAIKRGTASRSEWLLYRIAKVSPGGNPRATLVTFDHDEVCVRRSAWLCVSWSQPRLPPTDVPQSDVPCVSQWGRSKILRRAAVLV